MESKKQLLSRASDMGYNVIAIHGKAIGGLRTALVGTWVRKSAKNKIGRGARLRAQKRNGVATHV